MLSEFLRQVWADAVSHGPIAFAFFSIILAIELVMPARAKYPLSVRFRGLAFAVVNFVVGLLLWGPLHRLWLALGFHPQLVLDFLSPVKWAGPAAVVLAGVATAIFTDFFGYCFHRLQHAIPWLWRVHSVHHSIEELVGTSNYVHPLDGLFQMVLMTIPMSFFPVDRGVTPSIMLMLLALQPYYIHSPMRLPLGPLRFVFSDNRWHRIHHSTQPEHFDRNFGTITPLWDVLFRTAYWPKRDEWPETGLDTLREPKTVMEYLTGPWRVSSAAPPARTPRTAGVAAE